MPPRFLKLVSGVRSIMTVECANLSGVKSF